MRRSHHLWGQVVYGAASGLPALALLLAAWTTTIPRSAEAQRPRAYPVRHARFEHGGACFANQPYEYVGPGYPPSSCNDCEEWAGRWYWLRSPEQERRFAAATFNRYCIRCHGVDGRGVWDVPGVPDFANSRWQAFHDDTQLARDITQGLGAVMPPFRGTLTLEEACAMARYVRSFVPGSEPPRPNYGDSDEPAGKLSR